jgi:flagellar biosynthesis protein FliR
MAQILSTLLSELLFGTMLAISMHLFLIVFRTSGHLLGSLAGVNLGSDTESEEENGPLIEKFAVWVSGIVFVLVGAHRWMLNLVLESLRDYPLGAIGNNEQMFSDIGNNWTLIPIQFGAALAIGIKLALPAAFLLFVVQLAGEWVRRSLHTWDHAALGGAIPFVGLIAALMVFTSGIGLTFEHEIARWADQVQRNVVEPAAWSNRIEESTNNSSTSAALQSPNADQDQRSRGGLSDG